MFDRGDRRHIDWRVPQAFGPDGDRDEDDNDVMIFEGWEEVDWGNDPAALYENVAAHIQEWVKQLWPDQSDELNEEPQQADNPRNTSDHSYSLKAAGAGDYNANDAFDSDIEVNQNNSEESPQPGGSKRKLRDLDEEDKDEEGSSNQFQWWDELTSSDSDNTSDSDTDSTDSVYMEPFKDAAEDTDVGAHMNADLNQHTREEDPLPTGSKKRTREEDKEANEEEDERSHKKVRPSQKIN